MSLSGMIRENTVWNGDEKSQEKITGSFGEKKEVNTGPSEREEKKRMESFN